MKTGRHYLCQTLLIVGMSWTFQAPLHFLEQTQRLIHDVSCSVDQTISLRVWSRGAYSMHGLCQLSQTFRCITGTHSNVLFVTLKPYLLVERDSSRSHSSYLRGGRKHLGHRRTDCLRRSGKFRSSAIWLKRRKYFVKVLCKKKQEYRIPFLLARDTGVVRYMILDIRSVRDPDGGPLRPHCRFPNRCKRLAPKKRTSYETNLSKSGCILTFVKEVRSSASDSASVFVALLSWTLAA